MTSPTTVIILAAGRGSRMCTDLPKPLHEVAGSAMISHVVRAVDALEPRNVTAVVSGSDTLPQFLAAVHPEVTTVVQPVPRGTGDAVRCAVADRREQNGVYVVLCGDVPLIEGDTLKRAVSIHLAENHTVTVLGFDTSEPGMYGRLIVDSNGSLAKIVESADATEAELDVTFCNSGIMILDAAKAADLLAAITPKNTNREYYLTDVVSVAVDRGWAVGTVECQADEVLGANDRKQLAQIEQVFQARFRGRAMLGGATLMSPETVTFSWDTVIEPDVTIEPNVFFGSGVAVRHGATVRAFSHIEGAEIGRDATVGPFARLRPGTQVGANAKIGNFVEVKNAILGQGAKASHLSYIGDASVGEGANIGAGTITCNYDGINKHRTVIGAGAFIGSNTALVAPVKIGDGALVGAGSTITRNVASGALALSRAKHSERPGGALKFVYETKDQGQAA